MSHTVTLILGDGIGPEVMLATKRILEAAETGLSWEIAEAGRVAFEGGISSGVPPETIDSISRNRVVLKGPLETPIGYGGKSANVTLRKCFETYGNIRPVRSLPGIKGPYADRLIDFVIVRENLEDLYVGMEYAFGPTSTQALKMISLSGSDLVLKLAFEVARSEGRKTIHCATKANILKITEGLFKRSFEAIAPQYPDITPTHLLVDNCAHQMVIHPEQFDVVVMTNMNGDILSDLASGLVGGLGLAPAMNIGKEVAIFEAVHGSAPQIAGHNIANPTASLLSAILMLRHLGLMSRANQIENALRRTLAQGLGTVDLIGPEHGLSTHRFADAVIERLGEPLEPLRQYAPLLLEEFETEATTSFSLSPVDMRGFDLFLANPESDPETLQSALMECLEGTPFALKFLDYRGAVVGKGTPDGIGWRARFLSPDQSITHQDILDALQKIQNIVQWTQIISLSVQDGKPLFTPSQGL